MKAPRLLYRELPCLVADADGRRCARRPTCFAHYPTHRGMGAGKAGWGYREGVPLCDFHHALLDRRAGSAESQERTARQVAANAPAFWALMDQLYDPDGSRSDVKLPPFAPRDWLVPEQTDFVWTFGDDDEGAALVDVEVERFDAEDLF